MHIGKLSAFGKNIGFVKCIKLYMKNLIIITTTKFVDVTYYYHNQTVLTKLLVKLFLPKVIYRQTKHFTLTHLKHNTLNTKHYNSKHIS